MFLGRDIKVCYNAGDGRIYDRDSDEYVPGTDCGCLANIWGSLTDDPDGGDPYYHLLEKILNVQALDYLREIIMVSLIIIDQHFAQ